MSRRSLALVANFHRERRIGRKTANFLGAVHARLASRGIEFNIEFVLDRPDDQTIAQIEQAAGAIDGAAIHVVDFGNLGASRTFGVEAARAEVVCFTDGDDFFSLNWFEGALDHFSGGPRREVLHTRYMVGFDQEQFVRETTDSADPGFDPLSLAVDWYWSANLAVQREVFAATPIEPYDHAGGFGSEDWHWTCNSLAAGVARVSLPDTAYYYRVKPERHALGKVADVIHMASPLFTLGGLPPAPPSPSAAPPAVSPLGASFFEQARAIEPFELGVSYLRALEAGARTVRHYKPHTPPIVGETLRAAIAAGFGDGAQLVFADAQRLPGGLEFAAPLVSALAGGGSSHRLYLLDGAPEPSHVRPDGFVVSLGALRAAGVYNTQLERLVARFLIQASGLTVINLLSPRTGSKALAYSRATRNGVARWINLVLEYGFDALSQSYDELDLFRGAGVPCEDFAVFAKTAHEAFAHRGLALRHDPRLEAAFVSGDFSGIAGGVEAQTLGKPAVSPLLRSRARLQPRVHRVRLADLADTADLAPASPSIAVTDALRAIAAGEPECIFAAGDAELGLEVFPIGAGRPPGLRIPALVIIRQDAQPVYYLRPAIKDFNRELAAGSSPADLFNMGAIAVDADSLRAALARFPERLPLAAVFALAVRRALAAGRPASFPLGPRAVVAVDAADLVAFGGARAARGLQRWLSEGEVDG